MIWHYTTRVHLVQIMESGHLRLTPRRPEPGQVAGVWFTESPDWEPTAAKQVKLRDQESGEEVYLGLTTYQELEVSLGIARIGVDEGPRYLNFKQYEGVCSPEWAEHLVSAWARMQAEIRWHHPSGPSLWRVRLNIVLASDFKKIQVLDGGAWRDL